MLNDIHCHFFSACFLETLGAQRQAEPRDAAGIAAELGWDPPGIPDALADRWAAELDRHGVARAALIASVPGDHPSVAAAVARHPTRFVGFFMLDPTAPNALVQAGHAIDEQRLRGICLFPAMHHYRLDSAPPRAVFELAAARPGTIVFAHCGVLSVGARRKLGLPSRFDIRYGDPLDLLPVAIDFPDVPVIIPHFGAGLLREALMLADACPNVHLDTSSSNAWVKYHPGLTLEQVFRRALEVAGPDRLLFGTDSSFFPRGWQRAVYDDQRSIVDRAAPAVADRIFGGNFDRLLPSPLTPERLDARAP